jgi:hypothetical protein
MNHNNEEQQNEELVKSVYKRVKNEIKKPPDENYKDQVEGILFNLKPILELNKIIFRSSCYENDEGNIINLKEYLIENKENLITQFKFPFKLSKNEKPMIENNLARPTADNIISINISRIFQKPKCLLSRCFGVKKAIYTELKPLNSVIQELKDNNSQPLLKEDISKLDLITSPVKSRHVKSSKKMNLLTLCENTSDVVVYKYTKSLSLYLVKDIVQLVNLLNKQSYRSIIHQYTFTNNSYAFINDYIYLSEYFIRTNLEQLTTLKNIEHPLLIKGSVYIPNLLYIRHSTCNNFELLNRPISVPLIVSQLLDKQREEYNTLIILQNIEYSDILGYDNILVNLCGFGSHNERYIKELINGYVCQLGKNHVNVMFIFDCGYDTLMSLYKMSNIEDVLNKNHLKLEVMVV